VCLCIFCIFSEIVQIIMFVEMTSVRYKVYFYFLKKYFQKDLLKMLMFFYIFSGHIQLLCYVKKPWICQLCLWYNYLFIFFTLKRKRGRCIIVNNNNNCTYPRTLWMVAYLFYYFILINPSYMCICMYVYMYVFFYWFLLFFTCILYLLLIVLPVKHI